MSTSVVSLPGHTQPLDRAGGFAAEQAGANLYTSFVLCLLLVSLPIKNLAYLAPLLFLALQFYFGNVALVVRTIKLTCIVAGISLLSLVWDSLRNQEVNLPGVAMGVFTHLPLLIVLCERLDRRIDGTTYHRFVTTCCWFVLVQSAIGLAQFAAFGNPDTVCGTYGLFDGLHSSITIAQVYFTFTIFGMLLFMLPDIRRPLVMGSYAVGLTACAAAQSGHQTIFLAVALCLCGATSILRVKTFLLGGGIALALAVLVLILYPETVELSHEWYLKVVADPDSPKRLVVDGAGEMLQDGKNALLGVGLGQYCSRAALITSNNYLAVDLPTVLTGQSVYFTRHVEPGLLVFMKMGEGSAISKPYFSALGIVVELGLLLSVLLLGVLGLALYRNFRLANSSVKQVSQIGFTANVAIVFFVMCCFVENYAEFPQAIFLPVLLYVVALSRAFTLEREHQLPSEQPLSD